MGLFGGFLIFGCFWQVFVFWVWVFGFCFFPGLFGGLFFGIVVIIFVVLGGFPVGFVRGVLKPAGSLLMVLAGE